VADLKAQWKKKGKEELHSSCQNTKKDRGKRYYRNGSSQWLQQIKMNYCGFVSLNCMRAGHSSLKAGLSRFNIVFRLNANVVTGCKCNWGHIFWE
jgi:hypothetical protein